MRKYCMQDIGVSPLWIASQNGHNGIVSMLLKHSARIDRGALVSKDRLQVGKRFLCTVSVGLSKFSSDIDRALV